MIEIQFWLINKEVITDHVLLCHCGTFNKDGGWFGGEKNQNI